MSAFDALLLSAHLAAVLATGTWFVQIVHYPLFDGVGPEYLSTLRWRTNVEPRSWPVHRWRLRA